MIDVSESDVEPLTTLIDAYGPTLPPRLAEFLKTVRTRLDK